MPSMIADYLSPAQHLLHQFRDKLHPMISEEAGLLANEVVSKVPGAELISAAGEIKGKDYSPSHFLAMSGLLSDEIKSIPLESGSALDYLERKIPVDLPDMANGWYLVTFEGTRLGWLKHTPQGWKNHYPMNWRLRQRT
jgi:NOL1/NOP2/fmu family ribosome biogenesis protein